MVILNVSVLVFQFLSEVGFSNVRAEDRTDQFIQVIKSELQRAEEMKEEFIQVNTHTYAHPTSTLHLQPHICIHTVGGILFPLFPPFLFTVIENVLSIH